MPAQAWQSVTWREGSKTSLTSRFTAVRVRPGHRDYWRAQPWPEEWLLIEWPEGEKEPTKFWLSTLPETISVSELVDTAKLRWRIERDYQELKQEIGLRHYEGRGWRGFHHHATLCIAAYGFLVSERGRIPPSGAETPIFSAPCLPNGAIVPGALPVRPERHVETSIATVRIRLATALIRLLPRCPCCQQQFMTQ